MDWTKENRKDTELLRRVDRTPLDVGLAQGDEQLTALIEQHNASLLELDGRFKRLADDRAAMTSAEDLLLCDSATIRAERDRLIDESWDALVALRKALGLRQALARQLESHADERSTELLTQREKAVAEAQRALTREHRAYIKAEPMRSEAYVEDLASEDETVAELNRQISDLGEAVDHLHSLRQKAHNGESMLTFRQREAIDNLLH